MTGDVEVLALPGRSLSAGNVARQPCDRVESVPVAVLRALPHPARTGGEDSAHVQMLSAVETRLPPILVHRPTMTVIDGVHRLHAAALRGEEHIEARFFDGTPEDAFVLAVQVNVSQGLPLSRTERTEAVARIISSHPQWSDRRIALVAGVAANTVGAIRRRSTAQDAQPNVRIGRDGRARPRDSTEGRQRAARVLADDPDASLRKIARAAGISLETASDVRARVRRREPPIRSSRREPVPAGNPSLVAVATAPARERVDLMRALRQDPSLRFTESGRALLRLFDVCAIEQGQWQRIVENVPPHLREVVVNLARECAESWRTFADRLAQQPDRQAAEKT
jgi:ParB-like chromosome segregation protein Spo0J